MCSRELVLCSPLTLFSTLLPFRRKNTMTSSLNARDIAVSTQLSSNPVSMLRGDGNAAVRRKRRNAESYGGEDKKTPAALERTVKLCSDCRSSDTPLWRSGPNGPKSLCNACGIRYSKMRKLEFKKVKARKTEAVSCGIDGKSGAAEATVDMEELKRRQREKQEKMLEVLLRRRREMNLRRSKLSPASTGGGGDGEEVAAAARLLLFLASGISIRS